VRSAAAASRTVFPSLWPLCRTPNPLPLRLVRRPQRPAVCGGSPQAALLDSRLCLGPLLDRIDLQVVMRRLEADDLLGPPALFNVTGHRPQQPPHLAGQGTATVRSGAHVPAQATSDRVV